MKEMKELKKFLTYMIHELGIGKVASISGINERTIKNIFEDKHKLRKDTLISIKSGWDSWQCENGDRIVDISNTIDLLIKKL